VSIAGGHAAFQLTVTGTGFPAVSTVRFGSTSLANTVVSATQLTANVPANLLLTPNDIHLPRVVHVTIAEHDVLGVAFNSVDFTIFHERDWHIQNNIFTDQNLGPSPPTRNLSVQVDAGGQVCRTADGTGSGNTLQCRAFGLQITNLDRADPPGYTAGGVPRSDRFNTNVFQISTDPRMPAIDMTCQTVGFVPSNDTPIYWRLQIRHVLCRHQPQGNYRYIGACEVLTDEWQGKSRAAVFQLFRTPAAPQPAAQPAAGQPATGQPAAPAADPDVDYDYNTNDVGGPVMGGNAILTVAAKPPGCGVTLLDYVHLRIIAAANPNPGQADVLQFLGNKLSGRDPNIDHMVRAIFAHENNFKQFEDGAQTQTHMHFVQKHHQNVTNQPDCNVLFDWPDDPAHYPSVSFDWGVGISQFTKTVGVTVGRGPAWDWRENIIFGVNEFLGKLHGHFQTLSTWREWAKRSWKAYNGSGPQATAYANALEALPDGQAVVTTAIPATINEAAETAALTGLPTRPAPPAWPPPPLAP
jgi:hypothetical protein